MKTYDNYEISPCRRYEETDSHGKFCFEPCNPEEADVWTLYGHIDGEGAEAIGDFSTREQAEETFLRIAGIPFAGTAEVAARLRVMHAGPKLLKAATAAWHRAANHEQLTMEECNRLCTAIAEATGVGTVEKPRITYRVNVIKRVVKWYEVTAGSPEEAEGSYLFGDYLGSSEDVTKEIGAPSTRQHAGQQLVEADQDAAGRTA
jgi:hypothetical protein